MNEILEFLESFEEGATEEQLSMHFSRLKKIELASILNNLLQSNQIEIYDSGSKIYYKAVLNKTINYESMILSLLGQCGSTGMWLRDIKINTNIPHNLILKILRNLEASRKIKTVKSIKNNRKMYMLYDVRPAEDVTGGVWFSNNDVDLVFVNKLMDVIYKFCYKKEDDYVLSKIDSLTKLVDVKEFIENSGISEVELSINDLNTLIDGLIFDGKMEKYSVEDGVVLRCLKDSYFTR